MPKFNIGDLVSFKGKPDRIGIVKKELRIDTGIQYYDVTFFDGQTSSYAEKELLTAIVSDDPWKLFANNQHKGYEELGLVTTFHKVRNTANNTLSTLRASRTDFKAYQFKPLIKFLNSPLRRILVADEVGLGKTIEAGHILLELAGRGELKNVLIVCPKSLKNKWQDEMRNKFNFEFKIIETRKELINDFKHCKATGEPMKGIVTYDATRTQTNDRRDLKQENNEFLLSLENSGTYFDLVICDEAHYVRNPNLRHRGLSKVINASKSTVFLTATPLMTGIENLYHILKLLDNETFFNPEEFQNSVNLNKPFIRALNRLNNRDNFKEIAQELKSAQIQQTIKIGDDFQVIREVQIGDFFKGDPLFDKAINNLQKSESTPATISSIQRDLTDLNSLNYIFTRSRKREVNTEGGIIIRNPHSAFVDLSEKEQEAYDEVINQFTDVPLALVTKKRAITSCIPAYFGTEKDLQNGIIEWKHEDSKYNNFRQIVDQVVVKFKKKLIVFATFRKTLFYLKAKLEKENIKCILIYGDTKNRYELINEFQENPEIKVFLASQVGTEGVDLQFCNAVVNYDLPWNPMIVEQRIGRIDRIGQKDEAIHIYSLVLKGTIEQMIHNRLLDRINIFRESLGDLESILSEEGSSLDNSITNLELELYGTELTDKQRQLKIDNVAVAIETQKKDLELIKVELTDSMVNDIYFQNAINSIIRNQQYITENELKYYIKWLIREKLPSVLFREITNDVFEIELPHSSPRILIDFISEYIDMESNKEFRIHFNRFKGKFRNELTFRITFSQEYAKEHPSVEYINAYHPLIIATTNLIDNRKLHINQVFQVSIPKMCVSNEEISLNPGDYLMSVYKVMVDYKGKGYEKRNVYFHPIVLDANNEENISFINQDLAGMLHGKLQQYASEIKNSLVFDENIVEMLRPKFIEQLGQIRDEYERDEQNKLSSYKHRTLKQLDNYYHTRIHRLENQIEEAEDKMLPLFRKNLQDLEDEFRQKKESVEQTSLFIDNALISISYIQII
jgi:superfamily II DNA or RNA helicase